MITAKEARELSNKMSGEQIHKELEVVEREIKRVIAGGYTYVHINMVLSSAAIAELRALGYTVESLSDYGDPLMYGTRYKIAW